MFFLGNWINSCGNLVTNSDFPVQELGNIPTFASCYSKSLCLIPTYFELGGNCVCVWVYMIAPFHGCRWQPGAGFQQSLLWHFRRLTKHWSCNGPESHMFFYCLRDVCWRLVVGCCCLILLVVRCRMLDIVGGWMWLVVVGCLVGFLVGFLVGWLLGCLVACLFLWRLWWLWWWSSVV